MRVPILILAVFSAWSLVAQNEQLDSLSEVLKSDIDITDRVKTLGRIADQYQNPKDRLIYLRQAYEISEDGSSESKMWAVYKLAACMGMLGILDSSEFYFERTVDLGLENMDSSIVSRGYNGLGNIYRIKGELDGSLEYLLKAIDYGQNVPIKNWNAAILANVSGVYYDLGDYDAALEKVLEARALYIEANDKSGISYSANLLAIVHRALGNLEKALFYNQEALEILVLSRDTIQIIYNYNTSVSILEEQNRLNEAAEFAKKTVLLSEEFGERDPYIAALTTLSSIYFRQGKIDLAEGTLDRALEESRKYDFKTQLHNIFTIKALIAAANDEYKSAHNLMEQRDAVNDSIRSSEVSDRIAELDMQYETEKKEAEIQRLNAKQKQSRRVNYIIMAGAGLLLIAFIIIWFFYRQRVRISKELQLANMAKDRLLSVVAHDIKNPLSAMKGLSSLLNEGYDEIPDEQKREMVAAIDSSSDKLYDLLQNLLDWSISETGSLSFKPDRYQLTKISQEAIDLFKSATDAKKLSVKNAIQEDIAVHADYKMVFSVLRNLLANSISFTPSDGEIIIEAEGRGNKIQVCVHDTGQGISQEKQANLFSKNESSTKSGTGLGLVLCKEFVERHGGEIWIESEEGNGASFYFTLPVAE